MCDIVKTNFDEKYPKILQDLKSCTFIALDCEFTGLLSDDEYRSSLFDTPKDRYQKLKESSKNFLAIQLGISAFKYNRDENKFDASSYTFHLFPRPFPKLDARFMFQSTSIEFLCNYDFDFNKLFYEGISFLNEEDEKKLLKHLKGRSLFEGLERDLSYVEEEIIQDYCSQIAAWAATAKDDSELILDMKNAGTIICYFVHQEARSRFKNVWTFYVDQYHVRVKKVHDAERSALECHSNDISKLTNDVLNSILGFSKLFKEIKKLKKPVIGHNILLDLIMIYKQFIKPLPSSYEEFKKEIHEIFPDIYDTKTISFVLRDKLKREDSWHSNALNSLYDYLSKGRGSTIVLYLPAVNLLPEFNLESKSFHESGFDSFCAGSCFIKMAHIYSTWDEEKRYFTTRMLPPSVTEMFQSVSSLKNCINIMRAQVNHVIFDGPDPVSKRPEKIYVQVKGSKALNISHLGEVIAKFGIVDIQPLDRSSALIAASSKKCAREVTNLLNKSKEYRARRYNVLIHSEMAKVGKWITVVAAGVICGYFAVKVRGFLR